jgi:preprotein translocase subunit SecB
MADTDTSFKLIRIYLRDCSFESPAAPESFKVRTEPEIDLRMRVAARAIDAETYEVVLTASVTARAGGHTLYLCEAQQAGLFQVRGHEGAELERKLHKFCPKQLFPFLREAVASLILKGGFPPVVITPMKFDELYAASKSPSAQS